MNRAFLDSAYPPTAAQIASAKAAGYSGWNGYFAGPAILNGWSKADFDRVKAGGLATLAYCSGWSNPTAIKAQSDSWKVKTCLDVEGGIRALIDPTDKEYLAAAEPRHILTVKDGQMLGASSWIPPWLAASGSGVYGNYWVHPGLRAAFYILAAYPTSGDPLGASWWNGTARPGSICGWQWAGSHNFAGRTVDSSWFDDALYKLLVGAPTPTPIVVGEEEMLYVGDFHKLAVTLAVYADGHFSMPDPTASYPMAGIGPLNKGATIGFDGYVYSSSPVQSAIPAGADYVWWHATSGQWVPDAVLDTSKLANAPKFAPVWTAENLRSWPRPEDNGITLTDVDNEISKALGELQIVRKTTLRRRV